MLTQNINDLKIQEIDVNLWIINISNFILTTFFLHYSVMLLTLKIRSTYWEWYNVRHTFLCILIPWSTHVSAFGCFVRRVSEQDLNASFCSVAGVGRVTLSRRSGCLLFLTERRHREKIGWQAVKSSFYTVHIRFYEGVTVETADCKTQRPWRTRISSNTSSSGTRVSSS